MRAAHNARKCREEEHFIKERKRCLGIKTIAPPLGDSAPTENEKARERERDREKGREGKRDEREEREEPLGRNATGLGKKEKAREYCHNRQSHAPRILCSYVRRRGVPRGEGEWGYPWGGREARVGEETMSNSSPSPGSESAVHAYGELPATFLESSRRNCRN